MNRGVGSVGAALVVLGLATAGRAAANAVTSNDAAVLAAAAADGNRQALTDLQAVTAVDGNPVDFGPVIADERGRSARLHELAQQLERASPAALLTDPRTDARTILRDPRFRVHSEPRPLRGFLRWLGRLLRPVLQPIGRVLRPFWRPIVDFSQTTAGAIVLATAVAAIVLTTTALYARRRSQGAVARVREAKRLVRADPNALDRAADAAERVGDIATALRLRYQAGLIRLDRLGAIDLKPSSTATAVARTLRDPTLDSMTVTYERVAYGDHAPQLDELAAAKQGWATVLAGAQPS